MPPVPILSPSDVIKIFQRFEETKWADPLNLRQDIIAACLEQEESALVGCSKSSSGKAAGESKPEAYPQGYVEDFDEPRTKHGERHVSARRGRAGEKSDFFSILLGVT